MRERGPKTQLAGGLPVHCRLLLQSVAFRNRYLAWHTLCIAWAWGRMLQDWGITPHLPNGRAYGKPIPCLPYPIPVPLYTCSCRGFERNRGKTFKARDRERGSYPVVSPVSTCTGNTQACNGTLWMMVRCMIGRASLDREWIGKRTGFVWRVTRRSIVLISVGRYWS